MLLAHFMAKKSNLAADSYTFSAGNRFKQGISKGRTGLQDSPISGNSKPFLSLFSSIVFPLSLAASSELVTSSSFRGCRRLRIDECSDDDDVGLV